MSFLNILLCHSRSLKVIENGIIGKLGYCFLFAFHSNYGPVLYHFRDKARCWSKIATFSYLLHSTLPLGVPVRIMPKKFDKEKLEWCGYRRLKTLMICLAVLTQYRRVTDGRWDGQPSCDSVVRAVHSIAR